ncbi:hypothetical protein MRX96_014779 [Rhipicephalus microplus]
MQLEKQNGNSEDFFCLFFSFLAKATTLHASSTSKQGPRGKSRRPWCGLSRLHDETGSTHWTFSTASFLTLTASLIDDKSRKQRFPSLSACTLGRPQTDRRTWG